jgi:plastocyanin
MPSSLSLKGKTVTWRNDDTATHVVTTTAQQNRFLNRQDFSFCIPTGGQVQFTFSQAGLYHYYDTTMSTWNTTLSRAAAKKGTPHFPLAMDGVIWIQSAIPDLPTAAINHIPAGHDEFANEFLAIAQPGGVTWHNSDEDPHFVGLVGGWPTPVNPVDIGLYRIAGTDDVPGGATVTVLFDTPGLYYYYCRNHDLVDPLTHRARALPKASEYPIPMEGFVLVMGT